MTEAVSNARNRVLTDGREKGSLFCRHCLSLPTRSSLQRGDQDEDFDVQYPWVCPASSRSTTTSTPANVMKLTLTMSSPSVRFALLPPRRPEPRVTKVSRVPNDPRETSEAPASSSGAAAVPGGSCDDQVCCPPGWHVDPPRSGATTAAKYWPRPPAGGSIAGRMHHR